MTLIGISGKKRSGKDTVAKLINCNLGAPVHRIAFADALKQEVSEACETPLHIIEENKESFRTILQWWGTEFRRQMSGEQYWVNQLKERINFINSFSQPPTMPPKEGWLTTAEMIRNDPTIPRSPKVIVITDVRFPNEAKMVHDMGGIMLRVNRPGTFWQRMRRRLAPTAAERHSSETALDHWDFDYVIDNTSCLEMLEIKTQQFLLAMQSAGQL